jgi:Asp/Glu/hydantoin racemase
LLPLVLFVRELVCSWLRISESSVFMMERAESIFAAVIWFLLAANVIVLGCAALAEFAPRPLARRLQAFFGLLPLAKCRAATTRGVPRPLRHDA